MPASTVTELRTATAAAPGGSARPARAVTPYDFRRPAKLAREHVRALHLAYDTFGKRLTVLLTSSLRQVSEVTLREVVQQTYDEYVGALPAQTLILPLELEPIGTGALELSLPVALSAIDHMLGGPGGTQPARGLTDIETSLFARLADQVLGVLRYALEPMIRLEITTGKIEYNPQFLQIASASDAVVVASFDLTIAQASSTLTVCLPLGGLLPRLVLARPPESLHADRGAINAFVREQIVDVPVEMNVCFDAAAIDSSVVLELGVGDIVALGHRVGAPLTVRVGGSTVARAIAGKSGVRLAALVVDSPAQLLKESQ